MQSLKSQKESKMAKVKKKKGAAASKRRASLKGFASKGKAMFQSPVHSNGFKQDVLIDVYGGDVGITGASADAAAGVAGAQGMDYFKYAADGMTYLVQGSVVKGRTVYTAAPDNRTSKVK